MGPRLVPGAKRPRGDPVLKWSDHDRNDTWPPVGSFLRVRDDLV